MFYIDGKKRVLILIYKQYFDSLKNIGSTTVKFTLTCFMSQVPGGYLYNKYKKWLRKTKMKLENSKMYVFWKS